MDVTTEWDAARPMRRRPSLAVADEIALLERSNGELQAKLEEALTRVRELEAALEPFAKLLAASPGASDNAWMYQPIAVGDVRRARKALGEGGK